MKAYQLKDQVSEFIQVAIGITLASIGLKAFLLPNGFLDGGVTGIAILLSEVFDVKASIILPIISIPFFVIGYFKITNRILIKSVISILVLSVMIHVENFESITDDKLIIATFGGLFLGVGIGLAIKNGAVLDGSELLGIFFNNNFGISIGSVILIFNIVLFGITALVLTPEVAMYSILTYLVTSKAIDFTIQGFENYVGLMVISKKSEAVQLELSEKNGQGITVYKGGKGYGKKGMRQTEEIIHLVINRIDLRRIERIIDDIDHEAFIIEFDVNNIKGGKLKKYLS
ncbi:YitT family protein [Winogradskyella maritima]|uniref:YitT family protein n=1 Tax=Winogradskyella maritima TaxID=1517766 RepID=A0ABV8AHH2_9FLAO|nr:YitT family protein [Winogradskyella maritima]